jgi:hypothetical protein
MDRRKMPLNVEISISSLSLLFTPQEAATKEGLVRVG